jgi:DoxX-like family
MQTQTTKTFQHATGEKSAIVARSRGKWSRIRTVAFWATTFIIVFELVAGSVWNLLAIEWVEVQLAHLGYPHYLVYIIGAWHVGAAVAIIAPRLPLIKEWAYAGCFFLWSGAVASHLSARHGFESWSVPLMFATCAVASWVLRPADRRLPETRLSQNRPADAGPNGVGPPETRPRAWETRPRAWAVPIGLLVLLYALSFLTLPAVEKAFHKRAVKLGWIDK